MPEAEDAFVDYYRCIAGEHPDWDEYRAAMHRQNKSLIRITIERWGPIATGGMPPELGRPERLTDGQPSAATGGQGSVRGALSCRLRDPQLRPFVRGTEESPHGRAHHEWQPARRVTQPDISPTRPGAP